MSITDLEEATGKTRGALFYYSANKQKLFQDVVDACFFQSHDIVDALNSIKHEHSKGCNFLEFIHDYVRVVDTKMDKLGKFLNMSKSDATRAYLSFLLTAHDYYPNFLQKMNAIHNLELALWEKKLQEAQDSGEIKLNIHVEYHASIFRNFFLGYCFQNSFNNGIVPAELEFYLFSIYRMIKR